MRAIGFCFLFAWLSSIAIAADADAEWAINDEAFEIAVAEAAAGLIESKSLISTRALFKTLPRDRAELEQASPKTKDLTPQEIASDLRKSTLGVGHVYFCADCDAWHAHLSTGFVAAPGGIVCTSLHVLQADAEDNPRNTYPVAVDSQGRVYPIVELLAADPDADSCLVRLADAEHLPPLGFATTSMPGETVFLMSHPDGCYYRFTSGMISRIVTVDAQNGTSLRFVDTTAEYAPGSSGGALVNSRGNVVGHVSTIAAAQIAADGSPTDGSAVVERLCISSESLAGLFTAGKNPAISERMPVDE